MIRLAHAGVCALLVSAAAAVGAPGAFAAVTIGGDVSAPGAPVSCGMSNSCDGAQLAPGGRTTSKSKR